MTKTNVVSRKSLLLLKARRMQVRRTVVLPVDRLISDVSLEFRWNSVRHSRARLIFVTRLV